MICHAVGLSGGCDIAAIVTSILRTNKSFKKLIREYVQLCLSEAGGGIHLPSSVPRTRDVLSPATSDREQLGYLGDRFEPEEDIAPHLREPLIDIDIEDLYGPVPPDEPDPYVGPDPLVRMSDIVPTPPVYR